jgi:hypothetical protein
MSPFRVRNRVRITRTRGVPADSCRKEIQVMIDPENLYFPFACSPQGCRRRARENVSTRNLFPLRRQGHPSVPPCSMFSTRMQVIPRILPTPGQGGVRGFEMTGTTSIDRFPWIGTGKDRSVSCAAVGIEVAPGAVRPIIGSVRRKASYRRKCPIVPRKNARNIVRNTLRVSRRMYPHVPLSPLIVSNVHHAVRNTMFPLERNHRFASTGTGTPRRPAPPNEAKAVP